MKIVIPGGSGQVGQILARYFHAKGDSVTVLSRSPKAATPWRTVAWDGQTLGPWTAELEGADAVIHLSGAPSTAAIPPKTAARLSIRASSRLACWASPSNRRRCRRRCG